MDKKVISNFSKDFGVFDDVAKALSFNAEMVEKIISNIESIKNIPIEKRHYD